MSGLDLLALDEARAGALLDRKLAPVDAVPTPFPAWNACCRDEGGGEGLAAGWHVTAAARSGVGKSVLALNCAWEAVRHGRRVFFASLEMSQVQLETRFLAIATNTAVRLLEQGRHLDQLAHAKAGYRLQEVCDQTGGLFVSNRVQFRGLPDLSRAIYTAVEEAGCRLVIVDYLQLAATDPNDPSAITAVSHAIRGMAVELGITTFALSQFNRETSKESKQKPTAYGLMGGSAIENDSDQVLLVDHSRISKDVDGWMSYLLLDKNRHGPTMEIPMRFSAETLRMAERQPDEEPALRISA